MCIDNVEICFGIANGQIWPFFLTDLSAHRMIVAFDFIHRPTIVAG